MPTSSHFKNYVAGVGTGSVRMVVHVLTGLWLTPFTLHYLDRQEYAIFALTLDVVGWLMLLDFGVTAGLRIQAARLSGVPEQEKVNRLASTCFYFQNVVVLMILLVGAVLAIGFPHFFDIRPELRRDAMWVMALTTVATAVTIGCQTFSALLMANQQMHVDNLIGLLLILIRTVLTVVLLKAGWGIYSLAVAHLVARLVTSGLAVARTFRLLPGLRIRYSLCSWATFREIGGLAIWFSVGTLAGIVINAMSSVVTARVISVETVTALVLTGRFYELSSGLVFLISENARPRLGQMLGQNKTAESLRAYRQLFTLSAGLAIVAAMGVWSGNGPFVTRWVGLVNYGGTWTDLALAGTIIVSLWNMPNRVILSANLQVRAPSLVRIVEGVIGLGLSVWMGRHFGLVGIPLGSVLAAMLTSMWLLPLFTARMYGRSFWQFLWQEAAPACLLLIVLFPVALLSRTVAVSIGGYLGAMLGGVFTTTCGLALMWRFILDPALKARMPLREWQNKVLARTPFRRAAPTQL